MTHWIQNHILLELTRHVRRSYSQLRPSGVEANLFTYHLKELLKTSFIEKFDRTYQLSPKGLQFAGTLSLATGKTRRQPKILTAVICQNAVGDYLWTRWHRQPDAGLVSFPHGMVHFGAAVSDMAARELAEKADLAADLTRWGDVYVRVKRGEIIEQHMLVHLFRGGNIRKASPSVLRPDVCEYFWASLQTLKQADFVPGFYEIAKLAQKQPKNQVFEEILISM